MTSMAKRFWAFHEANPTVYEELVRLAMKMRNRGRLQWSIDGLFEVLRWERALLVDKAEDDYKLNNNFRAFYSRLLMLHVPELRLFFDLRASEADDAIRPEGGWAHEVEG